MNEQKYIVALDQGTTSSRAVILDHDANIVSVAQREFDQIYPEAGWVEHNPLEIWASQSSTMVEALAKSGIRSDEIASASTMVEHWQNRGSAATRLPPSVSPTSAKPPSCGTKKPGNQCTTRLSGSAAAPPTSVKN